MSDRHDPFDDWLARQHVEPLSPGPGAFERIAGRARRRRWAKALGTGMALLVVVAGVTAVIQLAPAAGPQGTPWQATTTSTAPSPADSELQNPPAQAGASGTSSAQPGQSSPSTGAARRCGAAQLQVNVAPGHNEAGHIALLLVFTNTSTHPCTMYGYPGVSLLTGPNGPQINDPAQRVTATPTLTTLAPNTAAHASLLLTQAGNYPTDTCKPVQTTGFRIYPPDDTTPLYTNSTQQACSTKGTGVPQIYPVQPGPSGP
jgi:hypothetical protein